MQKRAPAANRNVSLQMSRDVINLLLDRGATPAQLAGILKVGKSFISRVRSGQRSLTLEHLVSLEHETGEPIPWLLVRSTPRSQVRADLRPLYDATLKLLKPIERRARKKKAAAA